MGMNLLLGQVFVFIGCCCDCVKLFVWDWYGFWVLYKWLECGCFIDLVCLVGNGIVMSELVVWFEGIDLSWVW